MAHDEKVLVLVVGEDPDLGPVDRALDGADRASVRLVAPAHVGPLEWYGSDEDAAREKARERAEADLRALRSEGEAQASGPDPVLAVEDALSDFPADRILVAGPADAALGDALRRFDLPVELLEPPPPLPPPPIAGLLLLVANRSVTRDGSLELLGQPLLVDFSTRSTR